MADDKLDEKAAPEAAAKPAEAKAEPKKEADKKPAAEVVEAPEPAKADAQDVPAEFTQPAQVEHEDAWGDMPAQWRHYDDGTPAVQ